MPTSRSTPSSRRLRNPKPATEQKQQQQAFFQPKLTVGRPGDQYEREADAVADSVVNNSHQSSSKQQSAVQRKPIARIQRIATPDEEKMPGTNDERMAEDKRIQEKPEVQRMGGEEEEPIQQMGDKEEEPVQQMGEEEEQVQQMGDKEEEPVQQMGEEEEQVQQMGDQEEEPVQQMGDKEEEPVQQMGEEEEQVQQMSDKEDESVQQKEEEEPVQGKASAQPSTVPKGFGTRLKARRGQGQKLPASVQAEMEQSIGADFSRVRIHTDSEAIRMNKAIRAQAFTRGGDIYFNSGKFSPNNTAGKRLLAHELTHVVQQGAAGPMIQRKGPATSTPVPKGYKPAKDDQGNITHHTGRTAGVEVVILPDQYGDVPKGKSGKTEINHNAWTINAETRDGVVTKITDLPKIKMTIQTTYRSGVDPSVDSAYGKGTTASDKKAGKKSLRYHEGSHGTAFLKYMKMHPLPRFKGRAGIKAEKFQEAMTSYEQALETYMDNLEKYSNQHVDCVGTPAKDICHDK